MFVRGAVSIFAAALALVGVAQAAAAPKHVILMMMENHGTGTHKWGSDA